jgi:hypothetical protein
MRLSTPVYLAIHNAFTSRDDRFYCVTIQPDWKYVFARISESGYKRPRLIIRGVSDDEAPRGIIVYDGCFCSISTPLARDKAVYIEIEGYQATFARSYSGYKYTMFGDSNVYYCCVSPGCGCVTCREALNTGVVCVGRCDCSSALHSVDAAYMFDMLMVRMYKEVKNAKDSCACVSFLDIVHKCHMRLSEYCDNAIECVMRSVDKCDIIRYVPMKPLTRVNWDVMVQKLKQYVENGGRK